VRAREWSVEVQVLEVGSDCNRGWYRAIECVIVQVSEYQSGQLLYVGCHCQQCVTPGIHTQAQDS